MRPGRGEHLQMQGDRRVEAPGRFPGGGDGARAVPAPCQPPALRGILKSTAWALLDSIPGERILNNT